MVTQTQYSERMPIGYEGQMQGSDYDTVTGIVETVAGIGFGKAVSQGVGDKGIVLGGQSEDFIGITIKDITLVHLLADIDKYSQYENAGVMRRGLMYVVVGVAVGNGDAVHYDAATGAFSNTGGELLAGAVFRSSALAAGLALVYLPGTGKYAAT